MDEPTYKGQPVRKVRVRAVVRFDAYVLAGDDVTDLGEWRAACEIRDALEYHAVNLDQFEEGDALLAMVGGGSGKAVDVNFLTYESLPTDFTSEDVETEVLQTDAWL